MRRNIRLAAIASASLLAACGSNADDPVSTYRPDWEQLPDGSSFSRVYDPNSGATLATRCWPKEGATFSCLKAGKFGEMGAISIARTEEAVLPTILLPFATSDDGYSCSYTIGQLETISRRGEDLVSNTPGLRSAPWSRSYVERYMTDNGVAGPSWFPCLEVLDKISSGSLATLSTTSISRDMLGGS